MTGLSISAASRHNMNQFLNKVNSIKSLIASSESGIASKSYYEGELIWCGMDLCKFTSDVSISDPLILDGNIKKVTLEHQLH